MPLLRSFFDHLLLFVVAYIRAKSEAFPRQEMKSERIILNSCSENLKNKPATMTQVVVLHVYSSSKFSVGDNIIETLRSHLFSSVEGAQPNLCGKAKKRETGAREVTNPATLN